MKELRDMVVLEDSYEPSPCAFFFGEKREKFICPKQRNERSILQQVMQMMVTFTTLNQSILPR
jgi:hypothetical protein